MDTTTLKKICLFISLFTIVGLACDLSVSIAPSTVPAPLPTNSVIPSNGDSTQRPASVTPPATITPNATSTALPASATPIPATVVPSATSTPIRPAFRDVEVAAGPLQIVLSTGLASGARGGQFPRAEGQDLAYWQITPGYTLLNLEGYLLQGPARQPQIYVYPASAYAEMAPAAFESIHRLDNILYGPGGPITADQLPSVPFFNEQPVFASNIQVVSFQNGSGVRCLTEYAQFAASANNHDLFYHFQGLTRDGTYYIVAILPVSVPVLAETSDPGAALPSTGIPYPYYADPEADMDAYYSAVMALLNSMPQQAFTPTLSQLDALIQSMRVTP